MKYFSTVVTLLLAFNLYGAVRFDFERYPNEKLAAIAFYKKDNVPMVLDEYLNIFSVYKDISVNDSIYGFYISEEEFHFINDIDKIQITIDRTTKCATWVLASPYQENDCVHSIYRLADNQIFQLVYLDIAKKYKRSAQTAEESDQLILPKEIDQVTLKEYKELLFESVEQNQDDKKEIISWGEDEYASVLYQLSEDVFLVERPLTQNSYVIDFSNPEELCRVECFYNGNLILQVIYHDRHHVQGVAFAEYEDKSVTTRCNRQGIKDLTIEYIEETPNGIFLYNPKIDLLNVSLDGYSPTE